MSYLKDMCSHRSRYVSALLCFCQTRLESVYCYHGHSSTFARRGQTCAKYQSLVPYSFEMERAVILTCTGVEVSNYTQLYVWILCTSPNCGNHFINSHLTTNKIEENEIILIHPFKPLALNWINQVRNQITSVESWEWLDVSYKMLV